MLFQFLRLSYPFHFVDKLVRIANVLRIFESVCLVRIANRYEFSNPCVLTLYRFVIFVFIRNLYLKICIQGEHIVFLVSCNACFLVFCHTLFEEIGFAL
ncbi:MAG: hypothetical protein JWO09_3450 [Bacteroidetes bacterium]|nr:hypothetical protein [Bacteroidota bacterium]